MGILNKTKVYEIGHMQYGDGRAWREDMGDFLIEMGVIVFDPYKKPFLDSPTEDESTHIRMNMLMENGDYDEVAEHFKKVRAFDLSMVDRSDFIICYIDPKIPSFGTMEELSWSCRLKRPTFIVIEGGRKNTPLWVMGMFPPKYIYDSFSDLRDMIRDIDNGFKKIDSDRWRLFREELR